MRSPRSSSDPTEWTIDDVMKHISETDPALAAHAELFKRHASLILINICDVSKPGVCRHLSFAANPVFSDFEGKSNFLYNLTF